MKMRMVVELEYDESLYGGDSEEEEWFRTELLGSSLILHSNLVGDTVGEITVIDILDTP